MYNLKLFKHKIVVLSLPLEIIMELSYREYLHKYGHLMVYVTAAHKNCFTNLAAPMSDRQAARRFKNRSG